MTRSDIVAWFEVRDFADELDQFSSSLGSFVNEYRPHMDILIEGNAVYADAVDIIPALMS